jgi:hypothetical protein
MYEQLYDVDPFNDKIYNEAFNNEVPENYLDYIDIDSENVKNLAEDKTFMDMIDRENALIQDFAISEMTDIYKGDIPLYNFLSELLYYGENSAKNWVTVFLSHPDIKLYVAIITKKTDLIDIFLNEIDPRDDDNEAWHLAKKVGDDVITKKIKDKIIEKNWFERLVIEDNIKGGVSEHIMSHYKSLIKY